MPQEANQDRRTDVVLGSIGLALGLLSALATNPYSLLTRAGFLHALDVFVLGGTLFAGLFLIVGKLGQGRPRAVLYIFFAGCWIVAADVAVKVVVIRASRVGATLPVKPIANADGPRSPPREPFQRLTSAEKARVQEIVASTLSVPEFLTPSVHREFWQLADKAAGSNTSSSKQMDSEMRAELDTSVALLSRYNKAYWEDARRALATGQPMKSVERKQTEKQLQAETLITEARIVDNDKNMEKIAQHLPVTSAIGATHVFQESEIDQILVGVQMAFKRLEKLYTRPADSRSSAP